MRKITLTIEDEETSQNLSITTTVSLVNEMYEIHGINAMTEGLLAINEEINKKTGEEVKILLPKAFN